MSRRLRAEVTAGAAFDHAWREAAQEARRASAATADLTPRIGRARPLAERSIGTPDAGATSFAMIASELGRMPVDIE